MSAPHPPCITAHPGVPTAHIVRVGCGDPCAPVIQTVVLEGIIIADPTAAPPPNVDYGLVLSSPGQVWASDGTAWHYAGELTNVFWVSPTEVYAPAIPPYLWHQPDYTYVLSGTTMYVFDGASMLKIHE